VAGALLILSGIEKPTTEFLSFDQHKHNSQATIEMRHVQHLQNRALIQYLKSRAIPYHIALKVSQLKEAYYTSNNKQFFALAFENDSKQYELRNKYFKGCTGKDITTIPGRGNGLNLFEGFFDLLSAKTLFKKESHNTNIVLNSLANLNKVDFSGFQRINLFLDNDQAGITAANEIIKQYPVAVNRSQQIFRHKKDFNEYLLTIKT
jgi:hypothetical protein